MATISLRLYSKFRHFQVKFAPGIAMANSSPLDSSTHYSTLPDSSPAKCESVKPNHKGRKGRSTLPDSSPAKCESVKPNRKGWLTPPVELKGIMCGGPVEVSVENMKIKDPAQYQLIVKICKLALTIYEDNHLGKSYEFDSVYEVIMRPVAGTQYCLKFRAKNMMDAGNPIQYFKAIGYALVGDVLDVVQCVLLE